MKKIDLVVVKPALLSSKQKSEYVTLHQEYLFLDKETLLEYLAPRDYVLLFYDKKTKKLVATIGVSIIHLKKDVLVYFGNVVVDASYKHSGIISYAMTKHVLKLFLLYPFKNKYCCGLASSSGTLEYSLKYTPCWPNPNEKTPSHIVQLMLDTLKKLNIDKYRIENGNVITYNLSEKINSTFHKKGHSSTKMDKYFNKINRHSEQGEQVFFLNPITMKNTLNLAVRGFHNHLIKQPKLYHKIMRCKTTKPVYTIVLLMITMIKIKLIK
ncbi:hypothetical protein DGG96_17805 [Legionella qingyii]|uniref:N-acetyltransferase domain-containing protein n=1 Tax=Legionella qingyii TaxID=2184757 RepID=A0A317TXM1_9GAMM|nr:hypothetical protein [Legionella qingyii]PWY54304.1 hypothetical protein DGG96_17805 [Legionella qingyii]RUR23561.1 hypothetical protein ELY16_12920 [Legionella qingyii]RUR24040.1 hypothetical protein ELY20_05600 [Legionella qingyii]